MTGMFIYRNMQASDSIAIYALMNSNLDGTFSLDVIEYFYLCWPEGQLVAEDMFGNIVGALCGTKVDRNRASLSLFAVDARYRGQGIGGKLLESFRTRCYMEGYSEMQLEIRTTNSSAYEFYTNRGFVKTADLPDIYGPGQNGYRMVAKLNRINHVSS